MKRRCFVDNITIGSGKPLVVIAGPCVLEDCATNELIGTTVRALCAERGLPFIFKASFDKANRSSIQSDRGPGLDAGLEELARLRDVLGVPVTTDVHEPDQASAVAGVASLLQVPAFLCRQTDLLAACAGTGKAVNVKKGQFLAPTEMRHVMTKLKESGARDIVFTERGTFFGYNRLVNDFIGLADLAELGAPVCFDVTHSTQVPGGGAQTTGGRPDRASILLRAAVAAGVDAVFLECHPNPPLARSDSATVQPLSHMADLLDDAAMIATAVRAGGATEPPNLAGRTPPA